MARLCQGGFGRTAERIANTPATRFASRWGTKTLTAVACRPLGVDERVCCVCRMMLPGFDRMLRLTNSSPCRSDPTYFDEAVMDDYEVLC